MAEFPKPDQEFQNAVNARLTYITANLAKWGLVGGDLVEAQNGVGGFNTALLNHNNSQAQALSDRQIKDNSRYDKPGGAEPAMRALENRIEAHPACDNADRAALGIPIPGAPPPPPPPLSVPVIQIRSPFSLRLELEWVDSLTNDRARPANVKEAEIRIAITAVGVVAPPVEEFIYQGRDTESPYTKQFVSADIGKTAHFVMRWILKDGTEGPLGEVVAATIPG